ncbi:MAG: MFS transporter [Lachnospiraceae bacterium]|nr:MFS transporter [Lachnospiraceae bacterium]
MSEIKTKSSRSKDYLWVFLFIIIFINGFEAGGYQASLYTIGQIYDLSITKMGIFASVELLATMLAPLLLGHVADRVDKIKFILVFLGIQTIFSSVVFIGNSELLFVIGIFFLGLTTSTLQFVSIAALTDAYPQTGAKKIGSMTSMYALGAFVAPLFVNFYLTRGISWKTLFISLAIASVLAFCGTMLSRNYCKEVSQKTESSESTQTQFILLGVLLLCVVMCIYVGYENGFAFFVDTLFTDTLKSSSGKFALSIFWAIMIPSRILVSYLSKYTKKMLLFSVIAIPVITVMISMMTNVSAVIALIIPLGLCCGAIYPCVLTTLLSFSGNKKATATAMITVSTGVGGVVFTALTGIMADSFGMRNAMICLAAFFILTILAVVILYRKYFKE